MKLARWGNSYAIRIPKNLVEEYDLEHSTLLFEKRTEGIIIKKSGKEEELKQLLQQLTPQEEIDWGDEYEL